LFPRIFQQNRFASGVILLRHGQTIFNVVYGAHRIDPGVPDPVLTEHGKTQAAGAAAALREAGITRLIASPYTRALETAEILARALAVDVEVEPLIRERSAFSCDVGTTRSELARRWTAMSLDHLEETWWHPPPEPVATLDDRCLRFCAAMTQRSDWATTAVVTHWGVIHSLTGLRLQNGEMVRVDPASPSSATVV
jgi:broad specificity phosphatase PhoE